MSQERLMKVLLAPCVSEKGTRIAEKHRQFVFRVCKDSNKIEIRGAVELMFQVKVDCVRIVNVRGKARRVANILGCRKSWKKAYVTLKEGYDINLMSSEAK